MAQRINIPDSAYSEQRVSLSNNLVILVLKFNIRNQAWYLDIKNSDGSENILTGLKLMPNQNLTGRYILPELGNGNLWCLRVKNDFSRIDRDNLVSGSYSLTWLSNTEEQELNLDGVIQL